MLRNTLKIALRHFRKHGTYTTLNILTLAVGFTGCFLVMLFVQDELSYDHHHEDADRIYRVTTIGSGLSMSRSAPPAPRPIKLTPPALSTILFPEIPDIEAATQFDIDMKVVHGEKVQAYEERFVEADSSIFEVFTLPFVQGDPQTALSKPLSVVLTQSMAAKYFGDEDPMGKLLPTSSNILGVSTGAGTDATAYTVTGVIEDLPTTSTLQFDFIGRVDEWDTENWNSMRYSTYVRLRAGAQPALVQTKLIETLQQLTEGERLFFRIQGFDLEALPDIYLQSPWGGETGQSSDIQYVYIFSVAALLLLLIACMSYTNQALALSLNRAREVGVRKVVGASRPQLVRQFLTESLIQTLLALGLSVGLTHLLLPYFNQVTDKSLTLNLTLNSDLMLYAGGAALLVGILSGSYPAFFLSRFDPIAVLIRLAGVGRSSAWLRRVFVVVQFTGALALVMATAVLYQQMQFIQQKHLGFDKEHLVVMRLETGVRKQAKTLKEELLRHANILQVTRSSDIPLVHANYDASKSTDDPPAGDERVALRNIYVDEDFLATYGMEVISGRELTSSDPNARKALVNETAVDKLGLDDPLGYLLNERGGAEIVGVVNDFHFSSMRSEIAPLRLTYAIRNPKFMTVRIASEQVPATLAAIEETFTSLAPDYPFTFFFVDEQLDHLYRADQRTARVLSLFALLTLAIAALSLIAMAAFSTTQRVKEVGIRKVLGASVTGIVFLLTRGFTLLVLAAILLAAPLVYVGMNEWLLDYAYRIQLSWEPFAATGVAALVLTWIAVSYQAIRAALTNPVDVIRSE